MHEFRQYQGGMFDPTTPAGRVSGVIYFQAGRLVFSTDDGLRVELPLMGLEIKDGGAAQRMIFFNHPDHDGQAIYTTDRSILKAPELAATLDSADQVGRVKRRLLGRRALLLASLGVVLAACCGIWVLKNVAVNIIVRNVPEDWERTMGKAAIMSVQDQFLEAPEATALLQQLLEPLAETADGGPRQFELHLVDDEAINAFAAPGGFIAVNTGLILAAERPEQVLGVIAHEIAHVTKRHGVRAIVDSLSIRILLAVAFGGTDLPAEWVDAGSQLLQLKHSRKQEREADSVGWEHLVRAGIDPSGLEEFFELIQHRHPQHALELLSTHPAPQSRIDELHARSESGSAAQYSPVDPALLERLQAAVRAAQ